MEKIYMEENQQQQQQNQRQQKQQQGLFKFSIVLSFAVAIFGIFTVASFGLATLGGKHSGVSYAAPPPDSFTFYIKQNAGADVYVDATPDESRFFRVPLYFSDSGYQNPIYCVEHMASVNNNVTYNKDGDIDDYGLLYILDNSSAKGKAIVGNGAGEAVEAWATQVAIWLYLSETNTNPIHEIPANQLDVIKTATKFRLTGGSYQVVSGVYDKIRVLVDNAKEQSRDRFLKVSIDSTNPASIAEDGSFYESPTVTVSGYGLVNYDVSIGGVEGAYLVDVNGNALETSNIPAATSQFKVRIPAGKVGTEKLNVTVSATGHFDILSGSYYTAASGNLQKVVSVTGGVLDVSGGASFEIIPTPPTGMNVSQTIYFIGLIVLLCGVGIVYANAKPIENKQ